MFLAGFVAYTAVQYYGVDNVAASVRQVIVGTGHATGR
jgi:hypothetical protein